MWGRAGEEVPLALQPGHEVRIDGEGIGTLTATVTG